MRKATHHLSSSHWGFALYRAATWVLSPALAAFVVVRQHVLGKEETSFVHFQQRFLGKHETADLPLGESDGDVHTVWFHAASVGEGKAAFPLISKLLEKECREGRIPSSAVENRVILSIGTRTGRRLARRLACSLTSEQQTRLHIIPPPLDTPFAAKKFVQAWKPSAVVWIESEFWPNMLHSVTSSEPRASLALVNGRLSSRSYERWRQSSIAQNLLTGMLQSFDVILTPGQNDAKRMLSISSAIDDKIFITKNLKYLNVGPSVPNIVECVPSRSEPPSPLRLVVASTHSGEEQIVASSLQRLREGARNNGYRIETIFVPRHPDRTAEVDQILRDSLKARPAILQSSNIDAGSGNASGKWPCLGGHDFGIVDHIGSLEKILGAADVAIVGGSFVPGIGGHNVLEPLMHGAVVVHGPYMGAYSTICAELNDGNIENSLHQVSNDAELATVLKSLLVTPHSELERARFSVKKKLIAARRTAEHDIFSHLRRVGIM